MRRLILISLATVVVISLIILVDWRAAPQADVADSAPIEPSADQLPGTFDPASAQRQPTIGTLDVSQDGVIRLVDENNQLRQEYRWQQLLPRAEGEFDVVGPEARFYLSPGRVVHLMADKGYFVAPGNRPQSGSMSGNLVMRIFEAPHGKPVDLSDDSAQVSLRLELEEARFDATLGQLESNGPVKMFAPGQPPHRLLFEGRAMTLVFNEPQSRIDYLEITHGKHVKYIAQADLPTDAEQAPTDNDPTAPGASSADAPSTDAAQYYRVTFDQQIHVRSDQRTIRADRLEVVFGFDSADASGKSLSSRSGQRPGPFFGWPICLYAMVPTQADQLQAAGTMVDSAPRRSLLDDLGASDVIMTWSGRMIMRPVDDRPVALRDADDVQLQFVGSPVHVKTGDDQAITCQNLAYLKSRHEVTLNGTATHPLVIDAPGMGLLEAETLSVRMDLDIGSIQGPGSLRTVEADQPVDRTDLPDHFELRWAEGVDLVFGRDRADQPGLRQAIFRSRVNLSHPQVAMKTDQLDVKFTGAGSSTRPVLDEVAARGAVEIQTGEGRLLADRLSVEMASDAGRQPWPRRLIATGNVLVEDPTQRIDCGMLDATLIRAEQSTGGAESADPLARLALSTLEASQGVKLDLDDSAVLWADALKADAGERSATLVGSPIRIERENSQLRIRKLELTDDGRHAESVGPGVFEYMERSREGRPDRMVRVDWSEKMTFDDHARRIRVRGNVKAESTVGTKALDRVTAGRMTLELVDPAVLDGDAENRTDRDQADDAARDRLPGDDLVAGRAVLRRVEAKDDVVLLATRWTDPTQQQVNTRLRAAGPILEFDNRTETALINGPGSLLLEDYRPTPDEPLNRMVEISGRGATLFTWTGRMELSGAQRELAITGQVQMTHQPAGDDKQLVELQTNRLTATMSGVGGLRIGQVSDVESVEIAHFQAIGATQLRDPGRLISTHQLIYDAQADRVELLALPGRNVEIHRLDQVKPMRASRIIWHLDKDRVEIDQGGL